MIMRFLGKPSVTLDDIRRFRQLDSKAPGHPEYHWVSGVETTTGPLGQGVATSVGMAIAQKWLANRYNRPEFPIFDYKIYTVCGDGCMMERVVLADAPGGGPEIILIASGSEVSLAVDAHEKLVAEGIRSRVVSMPSWNIFEHQTQEYRDSVLPPKVTARVAIEQVSTFGWERYIGPWGRVIGMTTFGVSAPLKELQRKFGFEPERPVAVARELVHKG